MVSGSLKIVTLYFKSIFLICTVYLQTKRVPVILIQIHPTGNTIALNKIINLKRFYQ